MKNMKNCLSVAWGKLEMVDAYVDLKLTARTALTEIQVKLNSFGTRKPKQDCREKVCGCDPGEAWWWEHHDQNKNQL